MGAEEHQDRRGQERPHCTSWRKQSPQTRWASGHSETGAGPGGHFSRTASVQSLISWAWLSWLPNRLAGQGPRCSGAAPWHLLLLSLPAGKQQSGSQPRHSTWHLAWRGQAAVPSLPRPPISPSSTAAPPWSFTLCYRQHLHSWVTPGVSQWLQLEGQRLEVEKDFPTS